MFRFMLAPLEGYSDAAFRTLCYNHGADLTFTEMAHVESLTLGNKPALAKIAVHDSTPVQVQLLTGREEQLELFLGGFQPFPGFAGFNLNLSCPSPEVIRQGKGAAMIKRAAKTERLASIIRRHGYPVSVKIRLGTNAHEKTQRVYLNSIRGVDADFFVVHAKTASQESGEPSDYSVYPECVDAADGKPIIANGDVDSSEKVRVLQRMGVAGVMIGRAAMRDPAIFDSLKNELGLNEPERSLPDVEELKREYLSMFAGFGSEKYRANFLRIVGKRIGSEIY
ncbi:tRNA-dihydrouridine synthase family protein [Candidatus Bathyarchaeota archaeon]|nr:tRNA-dihydrouridine synthase family protein [Candidatus Bathyarchaeota archaeon]